MLRGHEIHWYKMYILSQFGELSFCISIISYIALFFTPLAVKDSFLGIVFNIAHNKE